MSGVKIEVFISTPPNSGDLLLSELIKGIEEEFQNKVQVITYQEPNELSNKYNIAITPALVIEELVRIVGVCPSKETLLSALEEMGVE